MTRNSLQRYFSQGLVDAFGSREISLPTSMEDDEETMPVERPTRSLEYLTSDIIRSTGKSCWEFFGEYPIVVGGCRHGPLLRDTGQLTQMERER